MSRAFFIGSKMSKKILNHPDKEMIIQMLLEGESVKGAEAWIKEKYPRKKRLHISYMTLQKFRAEHLNLRGEVLDDIKNRRTEINKEESEEKARAVIRGSSAYLQKIDEIANTEIDVSRRLLEMDSLISSRIEFYYNALQNGGSIKEDKIFIEYINAMKSIMQDWKKYIEGFADQKIEHNINVNVINEQARVLRESVMEVLYDLNPELVPVFISSLNRKLTNSESLDLRVIEPNIIDVI
jgi:hypothetical protein